jgi:pyruvate dehydrogenase E1 component alpha subunit
MMARIRAFEDAAEVASQGGVSAYGKSSDGKAHVKGPLHLSTGQEAVPTGVCAHLLASDYLTSTHRGHGHTLAKGADLSRMMCELYGKATGFNGGKGGSMHIADLSKGMMGANGILGAGAPLICGAALASKFRGDGGVGITFFGDGASNQGTVLESMNLAAVWNLPAIFVVENNGYAESTSRDYAVAVDSFVANSVWPRVFIAAMRSGTIASMRVLKNSTRCSSSETV